MKWYTKTKEIEAKNLEVAKREFTKILGDSDFMIYDQEKNLVAKRSSYTKKKWRIIDANERKMYREDLRTL